MRYVFLLFILMSTQNILLPPTQYFPRPSRMQLVMVCGDDDHYCVNYKKPDEAELPCAVTSMHSLSPIQVVMEVQTPLFLEL